ncbi:RfaG Glycosyltransferase [Candidatus Pelagibacterales bacterium]
MKKTNCKIRIANIIEEGRVGGPQIRNLAVASALKKKKIHVTLIFPKKNSKELAIYCKLSKIKYLQLSLTTPKQDWTILIKYLILFPFEVISLAYFLKKKRFDLVHVSGGSWQFKGILAAKLSCTKVVWELNDTYVPQLIKYIFLPLSFLANAFIFASNSTKRYYEKLTPSNKLFFLIQSPVDTNFFNPAKRYPVSNSLQKILNKKIVIGTIANISPVKNLISLLKSAKQLSSYANKIIFIVVGSVYESQKKYFKNLNNVIKDLNIKNFFFIGSRKDVRPLLKKIDIYVCSSKNESSPLSVWEAMSMKKAIISTDVGDVGKFVVHKLNGLIVNVNDEIMLANNIKKLINNATLRKKFGKVSRQTAIKKLDLKICALAHIEAYNSIIKFIK